MDASFAHIFPNSAAEFNQAWALEFSFQQVISIWMNAWKFYEKIAKLLTESCLILMSFGAMNKRALKICNAWEVGLEQTK